MKRLVSVLTILVLVVAVFVGCSKSMSGKYECTSSGKVLELKSNGTFYLQLVRGSIIHGKYEIEGDAITFSAGWEAFRGTIKDSKTIIWDDDVFVKK